MIVHRHECMHQQKLNLKMVKIAHPWKLSSSQISTSYTLSTSHPKWWKYWIGFVQSLIINYIFCVSRLYIVFTTVAYHVHGFEYCASACSVHACTCTQLSAPKISMNDILIPTARVPNVILIIVCMVYYADAPVTVSLPVIVNIILYC